MQFPNNFSFSDVLGNSGGRATGHMSGLLAETDNPQNEPSGQTAIICE